MSNWDCCQKERGAEVGCSRETVIIDGKEHDLIPFGEETHTETYTEMLQSFEEEMANGGRGNLTADDIREHRDTFKARYDAESYNNRTCHDCATPMGETHHLGCDMEECPNCGGQYFICDCDTPEKQELWADE